jgi:hypothetical protein
VSGDLDRIRVPIEERCDACSGTGREQRPVALARQLKREPANAVDGGG